MKFYKGIWRKCYCINSEVWFAKKEKIYIYIQFLRYQLRSNIYNEWVRLVVFCKFTNPLTVS